MLYTYAYELQSFTLSNLLCNTQQLADDDNLLQTVPMVTSWDSNKQVCKKSFDCFVLDYSYFTAVIY